MSSKVHIFRHAEGLHNLRQDTNIPDSSLTERGFDVAEDLGRKYLQANTNSVSAIIASPLRRSIQTSLATFSRILSSSHYPVGSGKGVKIDGVTMALDPDLQEISDSPCNTGSPVDDLLVEFPELELQLRDFPAHWFEKTGRLDPGSQAVAARKARIMDSLWTTAERLRAATDPEKKKRTDIIVVTHEGIILQLVPNANIPLASFETFTLTKSATGKILLQRED
jgi:broad specificity phosphatase PhoE